MASVSDKIGVRQIAEPSTIPANRGGLYRVKEVAVHAVGLHLPSHMAVLQDGRVLVSEFGGGTVRDISAGGDFSDSSLGRFASGLSNPGGVLSTKDGRVLVADSGSGQIHDLTEGGAASGETLVFEGVSNPYGLIEFEDSIFTSFSDNQMVGITDVVPGGQFDDDSLYVWDFPVVVTAEPYRWHMGCGGSWPSMPMAGKFLLGHAGLGAVFDVTGGGSYEELRERRFAWGLTLPLGMAVDPRSEDLYVAERSTGTIKRIGHDGGYARFAQPLIAGFQDPSCIRFAADGERAFVCDRAVDAVYRLELEYIDS
jgi:DNA-binding beta-propeller fold protein YncE